MRLVTPHPAECLLMNNQNDLISFETLRSDQSGVILRLVEDMRDDDNSVVNFI